ncbi:hypothetical protein IB276_11725 [Ensifer sp. ENS04]|uniref:hypothetical protein n=1 Tax=Ensifer sp. ENS04 TaxID=2769281 RepID=UPI001783529F|nr:hypothetical protein [Ensifer sp. ENS04]MBD9540123.1 hypothetical protein [Ensifer sp. ENS04]
MNMIEKVAQAIRDANDAMGGFSSKSDYEMAARAAMEAMREPTPDMVEAWRSHLQPGMLFENAFRDHAWPAAIDSALEGK